MQHTVDSKSKLAKLMATENLTIEHRKLETASFNLKDRVLYVPIWKDMSGDLYDLLLGHEVGHALETPAEGWHNAVLGSGKFDRNFKAFLNVVEDSRIEKKIKRRYPGLRQSFVRGYNELITRDFFGLKGRDINKMAFIDRLNLYTKSAATNDIQFTEEEWQMVREVEACETWQDVLEITKAIFDYSKEEQKEMMEKSLASSPLPMSSDEDSEDSESDDSEFDSDDGNSNEDYSQDFGDYSEDDGEVANGNNIVRDKPSSESNGYNEDFVPNCETDNNFRRNESQLLSEQNFEYVYVNFPRPKYENILTDSEVVHKNMSQFWNSMFSDHFEKRETLYSDFRKKNEKYISLLAKEFEMRKSATKYSKQKISETGDIDISRIYKYQLDDNIFRKVTKVPKGKSHGLVMMFDRSGSMKDNLTGTIEQILVLALFCKKVNIPFVVYGFGNEGSGYFIDHGKNSGDSFTKENNSLSLGNVYLRNYLDSKMPISKFNQAVKNLVCLSNAYSSSRRFYIPNSEPLSNTPLIEAVVALRDITLQFRKNNNLDIVKTVILHDGDADPINHYINAEGNYSLLNPKRKNCFLVDKKEKFQVKVNEYENDYGLREAVMNWYAETAKSDIIGFFITSSSGQYIRNSIREKYFDVDGKNIVEKLTGEAKIRGHGNYTLVNEACNELAKKLKQEKFLESNNRGYNKFFMIPGGSDIRIESDELEIEGNVSQSKIRNAFIRMNKKKQVSRVLVNRFIGEIAV